MASKTTQHWVSIQLDRRVTLEAVLLNHLERVPETRQQEWLRRLLLTGLQAEIKVIRVTSSPGPRPLTGIPSQPPLGKSPTPVVTHPNTVYTSAPVPDTKPFAALRKVMG